MTVSTKVEIVGLKDALKTLNKLSPTLRREITKDFKKILQPVLDDAMSRVPEEPLSNWKYNWTTKSGFKMLPWDANKAKKMIKAGVSGKRVKDSGWGTQNLAVFYIRWSGMVDTIFDISRNGVMSRNLTRKWGQPSRVIWRAYDSKKANVENETTKLAFRAMDEVNKLLKAKN